MAITRFILSITYRDYAGRDSVVQYYIKPSLAMAWVADPQGAGDAAKVETLIAATSALTSARIVAAQCTRAEVQETVATVTNVDALRGNRAIFGYRARGRAFVVSIPARNMATGIETKPNSVEINMATKLVPAWKTAFQDVALSIDGGEVAVETGYLAD